MPAAGESVSFPCRRVLSAAPECSIRISGAGRPGDAGLREIVSVPDAAVLRIVPEGYGYLTEWRKNIDLLPRLY